MRKNIGRVLVFILLIAAVIFFLPRPLGREMEKAELIFISYHAYNRDPVSLQIEEGSEELQRLNAILDSYRYHATLGTVFHDNTVVGAVDGTVHVQFVGAQGETFSFSCLGKQKILVGDRAYHLGYFGDRTAERLMQELRQYIEERTPSMPQNP